MLKKLGLYFNTVKYMKMSQIYYRVSKMVGLKCSLNCSPIAFNGQVRKISSIKELDYDIEFLNRFNANDLLNDKVTLLHSSEQFNWNREWEVIDKSALWNFNLHYCEYLFSLVAAYKDTKEQKYIDKVVYIIKKWIAHNPQSNGGAGWSSYTIALRVTNWLAIFSDIEDELDDDFKMQLIASIYEQYSYLSCHLEKDILGNHYFEDLKTLLICSLFFYDEKMLRCVLAEFKKECREQILADGMHFELSPMYHKLIFEDMLRVAFVLRFAGKADKEIESYLQPMLNVAWSLEEGLKRIPLFNDCGNNVAKSLTALVNSCKLYFNLEPQYKSSFKDSGYYIFKRGEYKLIVDAGQPGPKYIPGHAHCDAMSFELFKAGNPVIVNCGTYAYQCKERSFFRSTAAHNTVMINDTEQSQCWSYFRVAKRSSVRVLSITDNSIKMQMTDQKGQVATRTIILDDKLSVIDESKDNRLVSYIHLLGSIEISSIANTEIKEQKYAPEYGEMYKIDVVEIFAYEKIYYYFTNL